MAGAPTIDLLLHPQYDLRLLLLLPCNFAVYANNLVSQAQASAGLKETKILEPALPRFNLLGVSGPEREGLFVWRITPDLMWQEVDRRIDEVFEVLHAFRRNFLGGKSEEGRTMNSTLFVGGSENNHFRSTNRPKEVDGYEEKDDA
ncbi:hypothetical protein DFH06DRAFT_1328227 [Mycena polygramma]|nr:hypothetical protein DFH06DRAFT_1328227 [Mycena polygramma]